MTNLTNEEKQYMGVAKRIFRKYANDIEVGYGSDYFGDIILHEIEDEYLIDCMHCYLEDYWDESHIRDIAIYRIQEAL